MSRARSAFNVVENSADRERSIASWVRVLAEMREHYAATPTEWQRQNIRELEHWITHLKSLRTARGRFLSLLYDARRARAPTRSRTRRARFT